MDNDGSHDALGDLRIEEALVKKWRSWRWSKRPWDLAQGRWERLGLLQLATDFAFPIPRWLAMEALRDARALTKDDAWLSSWKSRRRLEASLERVVGWLVRAVEGGRPRSKTVFLEELGAPKRVRLVRR